MKKLSILLSTLIVILMVASLIVSCAPKSDKPVIIRYQGVGVPPDMLEIMMAGFDKMNQEMAGKCTVEFHGEEMVKFMDTIAGIRTGAIEMSSFPMGPFTGIEASFELLSLPYVTESYQGHVAYLPEVRPLYNEIMEKKYNQKVLGIWCATPLEIMATRPVKTADDWNGLLVMTVDSGSVAIVESMGGVAIPLPFFEGYQSLQKGVVDAAIMANMTHYQDHLYEVCKYNTTCNMVAASGVISPINLDVWNSLPKDVQKNLSEGFQEIQDNMNAYMLKDPEQYVRMLMDEGVEVTFLTKAERDKWAEKVGPFVDGKIAEHGEMGEKLMKIFEEYNKKYPYPY